MTTFGSMTPPQPEPSPDPAETGVRPEGRGFRPAPRLAEGLISGAAPGAPIDLGHVRPSRGINLAALVTVLRITAARQSRGRRLLVIALLFSLPIVLAILTRYYQVPYRPDEVVSVLVFGLIFQALVPLTALLFASGMVQDDVEEQTLTYLLIRPIPRWAIYFAKLMSTFLVTALRAVVFTIATLATIYWGEENLWKSVMLDRAPLIAAILALGLFTYVAIFGGLSLWVRRTLVVGAIYIMVFEGVISNIDFAVREATVMYHVRVLSIRWLGLSGGDWSIDPATAPAASTCVAVLMTISAVFSILGAWTFSAKEFRVKTPEGS
jgi:ABC-2 type transport system permease protein